MEQDHQALGGITARVKAAQGLPALVAALDELSAFLAGHFEREERDEGIFGILAKRGTSEQADQLVGEHRRILGEVKNLAQGAKGGLTAAQVGERAAVVASELRDHETREHAIAEKALGATARA
ncbi:MAG: hemerythrin domain-containing protein [Anaeromyxobacteraceae bacterium]